MRNMAEKLQISPHGLWWTNTVTTKFPKSWSPRETLQFKGNAISTCRRNLSLYLTPYLNTNSKWIKHLNWTVKLLEENIGEKLLDIELSNNFMDMTQETQPAKAKIDWWDYTKLQSFCPAKKATKQKVTEGKKRRKYKQTIYLPRSK